MVYNTNLIQSGYSYNITYKDIEFCESVHSCPALKCKARLFTSPREGIYIMNEGAEKRRRQWPEGKQLKLPFSALASFIPD